MFHCLFGHRSRTSHEAAFFIFICFVFFLSSSYHIYTKQMKPACWFFVEVAQGRLKAQIWLLMSVPGWLGAHGKGFTPTLDATAGTHSCLNRMLMKEKHRKSLGFGTHTHMRTLPRSLCTDVGVRYTIRLYVNQFRRSRRGLGSERTRTPRAPLVPAELANS